MTETTKNPDGFQVKVEIPLTNPAPGAVAVLVKADGSEEIIKTSMPTAEGVAVALPDGATVKIVDNSKDFADVSHSRLATGAVDFVSARELFGGTSPSTFTPEAPMTRAMLVMMLWRYSGSPAAGGSLSGFADAGQISGYTQEAMRWAVATGVINGYGNGYLGP